MPKFHTDQYTWEAVYDNGTSVRECNQAGQIINVYGKIDRTKLVEFRLYDTTDGYDFTDKEPAYSVEIKEGQRLIWRKRRHQRAIETIPFKTIYLIGWQKTVEGENVQSILYIYPDGSTKLSERKTNSELDYELFPFET